VRFSFPLLVQNEQQSLTTPLLSLASDALPSARESRSSVGTRASRIKSLALYAPQIPTFLQPFASSLCCASSSCSLEHLSTSTTFPLFYLIDYPFGPSQTFSVQTFCLSNQSLSLLVLPHSRAWASKFVVLPPFSFHSLP
jgi:hypothetical protein